MKILSVPLNPLEGGYLPFLAYFKWEAYVLTSDSNFIVKNKNFLLYAFFPRAPPPPPHFLEPWAGKSLLGSAGVKIIRFLKSKSLLREKIETFSLVCHVTPVDPKLWGFGGP